MKLPFSKIYLLIFFIALATLAFWGYKIYSERYLEKTSPDREQSKQQDNPDNDNQNVTPSDDSSQNQPQENPTPSETQIDSNATPINVNDKNVSNGDVLANITTEHCDTDCQAFANNLVLLEYCQQVCGIAPTKNVSDCDGKKDRDKDYCLKDLAINKKDYSLCAQIKDANLKQTCQNRIAQEIIENQ